MQYIIFVEFECFSFKILFVKLKFSNVKACTVVVYALLKEIRKERRDYGMN